jgi:hypothetical protein
MAKKMGKDANYDFKKQKEPTTNMGASSFANMPSEPMYMTFGQDGATYRDGLINSFSCKVSEISKIDENER